MTSHTTATHTSDDRLTPHADRKYAATPYEDRPFGHALCLSGGGFRAALFHLGALRRLDELGMLAQMHSIVSVSGGSILTAFLASKVRDWPTSGQVVPDWDNDVAKPFRAFVQRNLRGWPLLKGFVIPFYWFRRGTAVSALAGRYEQRLTNQALRDLPDRPRFLFCTTELISGRPMVFSCNHDASGDPRPCSWGELHFDDDGPVALTVPAKWPVARAVAASSAFPPAFDAMVFEVEREHEVWGRLWGARQANRYNQVGRLRLSDGGVYDNMGLEPVWRDHRAIFVSDGGATFDPEPDRGLLWRLRRYPSIQGAQVTAVRKRWLIARYSTDDPVLHLDGAYWGVGGATTNYEEEGGQRYPGYPEDLVDGIIAEIRTDLDAFSLAEIAVLENHGYLLANAAATQHASDLIRQSTAPLCVPHPEWAPDSPDVVRRIESALGESSQRWLLFGRR